MVVSPAAMLKLCQLSTAVCEVVTVSREPLVCVVAAPEATAIPVGLARACQPKPKHQTPAITRQSEKLKYRIFINRRPVNPFKFRPLTQSGTLQISDNLDFMS